MLGEDTRSRVGARTRLAHTVTAMACMPPKPVVILACFGAMPIGGLVEAMCRDLARVLQLNDRSTLVAEVVRIGPALVLLPLLDAHGIPTTPLVARLQEEQLPVGVCVVADSPLRGVASAVRAGAHVVSWTGASEFRSQVERLARQTAMSEGEARALSDTLEGVSPTELRGILAQCAVMAARRLTVRLLAATLGVSCRTLNRTTHRAHWPPPAEIIAWGRALRASLARWQGVDSPSVLARVAGFRTVGALRSTAEHLRIGDQMSDLNPLGVRHALQRRLRGSELTRPRTGRGMPS
jgi:hypothetical protein